MPQLLNWFSLGERRSVRVCARLAQAGSRVSWCARTVGSVPLVAPRTTHRPYPLRDTLVGYVDRVVKVHALKVNGGDPDSISKKRKTDLCFCDPGPAPGGSPVSQPVAVTV